MPFVKVAPGVDLFYADINPAGQELVTLLHGLGANGSSWAFQIPALVQQGYRLLIPDLRGFGQSSYSGKPHTIKDMASDIICLLDSVGLAQSDIVGISMGGTIALQLAYEYPDRVKRLVIVNSFARLRPQSLRHYFYFASRLFLLYTLGLATQARYVSRRLFPGPHQAELRQALEEQITQADPQGYRATIRALGRFNLQDHLSEIRHPSLVITGENDRTVSPKLQTYLAKNIPHARQEVIPGAGHAVTGERPEVFNKLLIEFLAKSSFP